MQLIIQTKTEPKIFTFDKLAVTIGDFSADIDLSFTDEELKSEHVKILNHEGRYTVHNVANDPFVTLNSLPFAKSKIQSGDILQIGHTLIRFEEIFKSSFSEVYESPVVHTGVESNKRIQEALDRNIARAQNEAILSENEIDELILEAELLAGGDEALELDHTVPILSQDSELSQNSECSQKDPDEVSIRKVNHHPLSEQAPEDSYIFDLEEHQGSSEQEGSSEKLKRPNNWNFILILFMAGAAVFFIVLVGIYVTISDRSDEEKMTAAEGVADVAMALTYAQVHHIKPQKQNWSDPEFIKNNLFSVLSPEFPTFANIDNQGQFTNCPYILRVYTSNDLSQFLVIAQPEPSLLQWLIPKTAIVVDSRSMEMRNITDLKSLNRLLVNTNHLDEANFSEISDIVKQGALIPLASLATQRDNPGFAPPKSLALIKPGADNLIYNAPRYYHFGESILNRAMSLLHALGNSYDVIRLKQEIVDLSRFPDLVLYSSQGFEKAIQAQKALETLAPQNKFLSAYLNFDSHEKLKSSYLLLNDAMSETSISLNDSSFLNNDSQVSFFDHNVATMVGAPTVPALKFDGGIDYNHPLYLQLIALANSRKQALKPVNDKMVELLNHYAEDGSMEFTSYFSNLWAEYKDIDKLQREKVTEVLKSLYGEYDIPLAQFAVYVKAAGLEMLAKTGLAKHAKDIGSKQVTPEQINSLMLKIREASDFADLEKSVKETSDMLSLSHLPDAEQLIVFQNQMRVAALERLRTFILSANGPLDSLAFNEENKSILTRILQATWVNESNENNYYLHEFEMRMKR